MSILHSGFKFQFTGSPGTWVVESFCLRGLLGLCSWSAARARAPFVASVMLGLGFDCHLKFGILTAASVEYGWVVLRSFPDVGP